MSLGWLPPIEMFRGDWEPYIDGLYTTFEAGLRTSRFHGLRVSRRRAPEVKGKPDGFWHVTSEHWEQASDERIPDLRRCERACWIAPMINAAGTTDVLCWEQAKRGGQSNGRPVVIALPSFEYAVFLRVRGQGDDRYAMLVTAFPLTPGKQRKFEREYSETGEFIPHWP